MISREVLRWELVYRGSYRSREAGLEQAFSQIKPEVGPVRVVLKPNLVIPTGPPTTTDPALVRSLVFEFRRWTSNPILIAEGSGGVPTSKAFKALGYTALASLPGVELVDLDDPALLLATFSPSDPRVWLEIQLPQVLQEAFLISVPALKEHTIPGITLSLKNLIGTLPATYYGGYWSYKKNLVHRDGVEGIILDLAAALRPKMAVNDASIGQRDGHLSGRPFTPPLGLFLVSTDLMAADWVGAELLGYHPLEIEHLRLAQGCLGNPPTEVRDLNETLTRQVL